MQNKNIRISCDGMISLYYTKNKI